MFRKYNLLRLEYSSAARLLLTTITFALVFLLAGPSGGESTTPNMTWLSAKIWLQSADCARETGVVIVLCRNGRLIPLADEDSGEDPGHALALGLYSAITQNQVQPADISRVNTSINYLGIALLSILLFCLDLPLACFLTLTLGAVIANQYHGLTPHPAQFGATALSVVLPLVILGMYPKVRAGSLVVWTIVGISSLGLAALFRQAIGLMGAVTSLTAILINISVWPRTRKALAIYATLAVAVLIGYHTPYFLLRARDTIYRLPPTHMMEQHGAWHSLYIGLGAVSNPFGIEWNDSNADAAVKKIDPSIQFATKKYYDTLRSEYFNVVTKDPISTLHLYLQKFWLALDQKLPTWPGSWPLYLPIILIIAATWVSRLDPLRGFQLSASDAIFIVSGVFAMMFLGQATLVHFSMQYLFPIQLFFVLSTGAIAELIFAQNPDTIQPDIEPVLSAAERQPKGHFLK